MDYLNRHPATAAGLLFVLWLAAVVLDLGTL